MFEREIKLIGIDNLNKIKSITVAVIGVGGVGGYAVESLVRAGISNILVVDYDTVDITNLNRQVISLQNNIGKYKVDVAEDRIKLINKNINVIKIRDKLDINNVNNLPITDYIIDACDDINAKVLLVKFALKNNIKIISSCGTGNRINPSLLTITNIWKTQYDPLAKKFRYMLRKEHISYKLPVVCSSEMPIIKQSGSVGSMGLVPNCCGIFLASYVINDILKK